MPFYKLVASGRPNVVLDEIVLSRSEESGEIDLAISTKYGVELSGDTLATAQTVAANFGYEVVEVSEPQQPQQPVGQDVVGQSPAFDQAPQQGGTAVQDDQLREQELVDQVSDGPTQEGQSQTGQSEQNPTPDSP
jgi:hypothetical protein